LGYISGIGNNAEKFGKAIRNHRGTENSVHEKKHQIEKAQSRMG